MALLDDLGYGGDQFRLDPAAFGPEVGLLDPITLARMEKRARSVPAPHGPGAPIAAPTTPVEASPLYPPPAPGISVPAPHGPGAPIAAPTMPVQASALPDIIQPATPSPAEPSFGPGVQPKPWFTINRDAPSSLVGGILGGGIERPTLALNQPPAIPGTGRVSPEFGGPPETPFAPTPVRPVPGTVAGTPLPNRYQAGPGAVGVSPLPPEREIGAKPPPPTSAPQAAATWMQNPLGAVDQFLVKNSNVFLGLARGFGGARTLGEAFSRAAEGVQEGAQLDRTRNAISMTRQMLLSKGYSEEEADAIANNPAMMQQVIKNVFAGPTFTKTGEIEDMYGKTSQYRWVSPPPIRYPPGTRVTLPNGRRLVSAGGTWMEDK